MVVRTKSGPTHALHISTIYFSQRTSETLYEDDGLVSYRSRTIDCLATVHRDRVYLSEVSDEVLYTMGKRPALASQFCRIRIRRLPTIDGFGQPTVLGRWTLREVVHYLGSTFDGTIVIIVAHGDIILRCQQLARISQLPSGFLLYRFDHDEAELCVANDSWSVKGLYLDSYRMKSQFGNICATCEKKVAAIISEPLTRFVGYHLFIVSRCKAIMQNRDKLLT